MKRQIILIGFMSTSFLQSYSQATTKTPFAQNVEAITSLAWPVIAVIIFCVLYPQIKNITDHEAFLSKLQAWN